MGFSTEFKESFPPTLSTISLWVCDDDFAWLVMDRTLASVDLMTGLFLLEYSLFLHLRLLHLRSLERLALALLAIGITHRSFPTELVARWFAQSSHEIAW